MAPKAVEGFQGCLRAKGVSGGEGGKENKAHESV